MTTSISVRAEPVEVGTDAPDRKYSFQSVLFEWFFNPHPSTSFLRQAQDRQGERIEKHAFRAFFVQMTAKSRR
ncbi:MAG: hypothetical protein LBD67_07110 [Candidatus Accumulibacter sp.]|nr:hypothetical protein [Accumulibacter sp.]